MISNIKSLTGLTKSRGASFVVVGEGMVKARGQLKILVVYDEQHNIVHLQEARKDINYSCVACGGAVIFRHGQIKVPHFAHKPSEACSQETIIHQSAKLLIRKAIADWKNGISGVPIIYRQCRICKRTIKQKLPEKVDAVVLEARLPEGLITDIGLIVRGKIEAVIEVKVTHAVDIAKEKRFSRPFIEVDGDEILNNPIEWHPTIDRFNPIQQCTRCKLDWQKFKEKTLRIAQQTGCNLPISFFRYAPTTCWRCYQEILVFTWPGHMEWAQEFPNKHLRPSTLSYRYSKMMGGKYWANVCSYCGVIQGDGFIHSEPDGPFFAFYCVEDTPEAFLQDLMILASLNANQ